MVSNSNLPLSLWSEAIKTMAYVLNRVPTKAIPKMPFELWKSWKPSLRYVHVWGCPTEVRVYNPQEKKLDLRLVNGCFIGYVERSKRYIFYCPSCATKIVESYNTRFLENDMISESNEPQHLVFKERHNIGVEYDPITFSQAMDGSESTLCYNAMKDEMNFMANNQVWDLVELPKVQRSLVVNGFLKLKETHWAILKDIRQD